MTTPGTGTWRFYDVDADANFYPTLDSISIVNQQPCQLAVFTGTIKGTTNPLAKEHEVIAYYTPTGGSEGKMFGGDISVYTLAHVEPGGDIPVYSFSARDYTARLDDTIITDGLRPAETLNSRLAWLVAYTPMFEVTDGTSSITADLAAYDYTSLSKREALQHMAGLVGAVFYVNFDKALKFYSADATIAADFGLATPASPPTSYEYRNFTLDEDTTDRADDIFVEGTDISTWRPSDTPSGGKQRALVDTNIADLGTAQQAGDIELARIGTAQISGALEMFQPGLESGQTVHIVNPTHSLDDDYIISSTSISCISTNDEALTIIGVQFADRLLCRPQPDFSRDNSATDGNGGGDTGTCGRATALLTDGVDADLWLESGGGEQIFVGDGDKVAKYKLDLGTKIWEVSETGSVPYGSHQPGTYVPINFGDKAYRRDNGVERWSLDISAIAAQVQDRKKFWVTSGAGGSVLPELGYGDFSVDFGPVASPVIVWRGYVTSVPGSGYPLDVTVTGGGRHQVYCGATTNFPYNGVGYGMIMVTDASWTDSGTPPTEADVAALWDPATSFALPYMFVGGSDSWPFGAHDVATGSGYPKWADVTHQAPPTFTSFTSGQWIVLYVAAERINYAGAGHPGAIGTTGARFDFTVAGTLGLMSESHGTTPVLQVRDSIDGSLDDSATLASSGLELRRSWSGQFVMCRQGTDTIERYDRTPALSDTVTITDFFPADDWAVDDAYNLYQLSSNVLTKFDSGGTQVWQKDLNSLYGYRFPSRVSAGNGNQIIVDEFIFVAGYTGSSDWTSDGEACLLILAKNDGTLKVQRAYGGAGGSDVSQAEAVHHHADGCLYLAGAANGTLFEDQTISGLSGWLLRDVSTMTDVTGETPVSTVEAINDLTDARHGLEPTALTARC